MEEELEEGKVLFQQKHAELVKIIKSFENLEKSQEWETLKELVFNDALKGIEKQILTECTSPVIDLHKLYKLQGERIWARRYCNVDQYIETLKKQLEDINKKIK